MRVFIRGSSNTDAGQFYLLSSVELTVEATRCWRCEMTIKILVWMLAIALPTNAFADTLLQQAVMNVKKMNSQSASSAQATEQRSPEMVAAGITAASAAGYALGKGLGMKSETECLASSYRTLGADYCSSMGSERNLWLVTGVLGLATGVAGVLYGMQRVAVAPSLTGVRVTFRVK